MKKILLYILLLTGTTACSERIDIVTDNATPRLAITGYITTEKKAHQIQISRTVAYFGYERSIGYDNAIVRINGTNLIYTQDGFYETSDDFYGIPGQSYTLDVWLDFDENGDKEHYTATTSMPTFASLDSMSLRPIQSDKPLGPPWLPFVHFMDVPGANHYGVHMYIHQLRDSSNSSTKFNGKYSISISQYFLNLFDDKAAEGEHIDFPAMTYYIQEEMSWVNDGKIMLQPGDTITLELNLLSPEYFEFIRTAKEEIHGGNPLFAGPPSNVPGNISGNALGIFGAYTISRASTTLPSTPDFPKK